MPATRDDYVVTLARLIMGWYVAKTASPTVRALIERSDVEELIQLGQMAKRMSGFDPAPPMTAVAPGETINLTIPPEAMVQTPPAETPAEAPQS